MGRRAPLGFAEPFDPNRLDINVADMDAQEIELKFAIVRAGELLKSVNFQAQ